MKLFLGAIWGVVLVEAALKFTVDSWTNVVTGVPFIITWSGRNGSIILTLENGTTSNPLAVNVIASSIASNSYAWTPGNKATVGGTFFMNITDAAGDSDVGDKFVVLASSSTTQSSSVSVTATRSSSVTQASSSVTQQSSSSNSGAQSTSSAGATSNSNSTSNGLSTGARAGLGVGVALGVCLVFAGVVFFWRKKRQSAINDTRTTSDAELMGSTPGKMPEKQSGPAEMSESQPSAPPVELQTNPVRYELA